MKNVFVENACRRTVAETAITQLREKRRHDKVSMKYDAIECVISTATSKWASEWNIAPLPVFRKGSCLTVVDAAISIINFLQTNVTSERHQYFIRTDIKVSRMGLTLCNSNSQRNPNHTLNRLIISSHTRSDEQQLRHEYWIFYQLIKWRSLKITSSRDTRPN